MLGLGVTMSQYFSSDALVRRVMDEKVTNIHKSNTILKHMIIVFFSSFHGETKTISHSGY